MSSLEATLRNLRSTRDLRAEMIALAARLAGGASGIARLRVIDPVISPATVRAEWAKLLPALAAELRARMELELIQTRTAAKRSGDAAVPLDRPNFRFEVLRLLIEADLAGAGPQSFKGLLESIGASETPIREALTELKQASGIIFSESRGVQVRAEAVSSELLAKVGALPQTLRFRFERGARLKAPAELLQRAETLLGPRGSADWQALSLSGAAVASREAASLDLIGMPRLDLLAALPRDQPTFDADLMRLLDDGLELEPSVMAPAPVVLTVARAQHSYERSLFDLRCASHADVFLSLLDLGLREQALQYVTAVHA
jgi:hypothetical protein